MAADTNVAEVTLIPGGIGRFLRRGLLMAGLGVLIAAMLTIGLRHRFAPTLVHSVAISLGCWFFIDVGRLVAARLVRRRRPGSSIYWPGAPWMLVVIIVGTTLGYLLGSKVGTLFTGADSLVGLIASPQRALGTLLFSLVPAIGITYYFYSRERLAASHAEAQASRRLAAETQLRLLESQLEPHMLFNTLANLRVLIALDPPRAQAMLDQLISFLRATLAASRAGQHALSAEFSRLADYLALMQVRMGDRLQTRLDLPEALASVAIPPLLLQPLVENAIKHGLEPKVAGGRIVIEARQAGDKLVLQVRDTGLGLGTASAGGTSFGLAQVRERLATLYGERASLRLEPATDSEGGALAVVTLPLKP
jgi:hypothetical protein